ncbi:hypothetical protein Bra3105_08170 [Brachybacterium halotolerans subsp. kimchii]|uniref:hypothetical protein n=1 Tax=Brachybacterium halotolerans TaxID=2795215 RepID=UPI001E50CC83|nr:hypothetical protein [Brachybacterium halotolerans]UEJ84269.1 hypothetical protein Bra3105_08170 [Brachybacterium halotolerans subsp. kimchii]
MTERPTGPELGRVAEAFHAARGVETDADWAELALVRLVFGDVRIDVVEQVLTEAAGTVREAQESPAELFGAPSEWADQQAEQLREAGLDVFEDPLIMGWREGVLTTLGLASGLSALFFLSQLLDLLVGSESGPTDVTAGFALMPLLLSAMLVVVIAVYKRAVARFRFPIVVALCAAVVVLGAGGVASIIVPLAREGADARLAWGWSILLVPLYAALCWVVAKLWRAPAQGPGDREGRGDAKGREDVEALTPQQILDSAHLDDEDWVRRARAALRRRDDFTDPRIDAVLTEAQAHAAESGAPLVEEFGSPEGYAQKLPKDPRTIPRRMTLFYAVLALLWLALALADAAGAGWHVGWSVAAPAVLAVAFGAMAVGRARAWHRVGRSS